MMPLRMGWVGLMIAAGIAGNGWAFDDDPFGVRLRVLTADGTSGSRLELHADFSVPLHHYLYADALSVSHDGRVLEPVLSPEPEWKPDPFTGEPVQVYTRDVGFRYPVNAHGSSELAITVAYMGCNQQLCFMPRERTFRFNADGIGVEFADSLPGRNPAEEADADPSVFDGFRLTGRASGYLSVSGMIGFLERVEEGLGLEPGRLETLVAGRGIWIGLVAILLGGLALNLTPCVLPMIPVNLAVIGAGARAGSRRRGFLLGTAYGAGMTAVYGLLGIGVILTGAQFGSLNATVGFNLLIAAVFLVLALAMLGVFNLDFTRYQSSMGAPRRGGAVLTALFFGGVAALLAGACVAPVVISVLVLATEFYQRGHALALLLPFVLGAGMALPWPLAGAGISVLPRPGRWMEKVKIGFGILILAAAGYYAYQGIERWRWSSGTIDGNAGNDATGFWMTDPDEAVARARKTGQPLFVDFWATWCKNCLAMDATTFRDQKVRTTLDGYVRLKYQAENPSDPETRRLLDAFGIRGLPAYVVLESVNRPM